MTTKTVVVLTAEELLYAIRMLPKSITVPASEKIEMILPKWDIDKGYSLEITLIDAPTSKS